MHCLPTRAVAAFAAIVMAAAPGPAADRDRAKIPEKYKWNLSDLYASDGAWGEEKQKLAGEIPSLSKYQGTLLQSPAGLLACLDRIYDVAKRLARLSVYASLNSSTDTRNAGTIAMTQEMGQLGSDFNAAIAFLEPEVLRLGEDRVQAFLAREPKLTIYRQPLDDILRRGLHTGTAREERIIADAGLMDESPGSIYTIFSNAEFPFPSVTLADGSSVRLDKAAFNLYRSAADRNDRKNVFAAYMGKLAEFRGTFGAQLYAQVKRDMFYMRARNYGSCLQSSLDRTGIPAEVYSSLIRNVNLNLPTFHRYLRLRQRLLGVDTLHYYDLYAPAVGSYDVNYTFEDGQKLVLASLTPLGVEYLQTAGRAFLERWFDVYPNDGKVAGAFSSGGAYEVHPYMLLNYNTKYDDVSTLAHELGHTMHSHLANTAQPYPTSQYSPFVAEVASTFNEALLLDHMLRTVSNVTARLALLSNHLDNLRGTFFRQTQFAEFELAIHEMAERGQTLTGESLDALYLSIARKYFGHDAGVCVVDDNIRSEWANVPHFYYNFYVFQYATSMTASAALSEQVLAGDRAAAQRYLALLSAGGSDYPVALLKSAGIDMTGPVPFELMMKKINRVMDEMERILERK
jgi:oligoendopeptidase F